MPAGMSWCLRGWDRGIGGPGGPARMASRSAAEDSASQAVRIRLAGYKVPKTVQVIDVIPMSPVGKVLRRALREPLWNRPGQ
jgi:acyl-CoA synthetase (AMP-forming)/AMP-acid ligase II